LENYPKLFIPGPTHVPKDVMQSLTSPQIGHRTPEFSDLMSIIVEGVQKVLYTNNHIYLVSNPATGIWEMAVRNTVKKGILHAVNGSFSSKWATVSNECDYNVGILDYEWGKGIKPEDVDELLSSGKYDVFAMVHNETSTGVMSPLEPIAELLQSKYPEVIWLVDAVSSMAGHKIEVDKLGIDLILSSTQKAWGLPAGFAVCAVSNKIIERSRNMQLKGYFLDIMIYEKYYAKMQTPSTPSIAHMFGLKYILEKIENEGLEKRWIRHQEMAKSTRIWAINHGQSLFPEKGFESITITCIYNQQKWDINKINDRLLEKGFRMDRGYGKLRGSAFRISHMGNIMPKDLTEYLQTFDEVL
tara:strand:+ start:780 stop:1850 length:1071 start_codon:yes stop_codon:yes gene_type:complete